MFGWSEKYITHLCKFKLQWQEYRTNNIYSWICSTIAHLKQSSIVIQSSFTKYKYYYLQIYLFLKNPNVIINLYYH